MVLILIKQQIFINKIIFTRIIWAKRHVKNYIEVKIYIDNNPIPNEIKDVVGNDKYSNGLVVFDLYVKDYNMLTKRFDTFITLREYIQFHIHLLKHFFILEWIEKEKKLKRK